MAVNLKKRGVLVLKGLAMGAADVVPGVSGGTIAFITGIYEELLGSLKSINATAVRKLFKEGIGSAWRHINGWFLLTLFLGIGLSIASLAKAITHVLDNYPVLIWSFFFGLILASILLVGKTVRRWTIAVYVGLLIGAAVSYYVTTITTVADETTNLGYILMCGVVSICAMILPGISGSFILLLMGAYTLIIGTVKSFVDAVLHFEFGEIGTHLKIAGTFAVGAVVGLVSFSHVLTYLFKRFHDFTIALLIGFLIGSLNKIWPWKETLSTRIHHPGKPDEKVKPFIQDNVLPWNYETVNSVEAAELGLTVKDAHLFGAIGLVGAGLVLIWLLDRFGPDEKKGEPDSAQDGSDATA